MEWKKIKKLLHEIGNVYFETDNGILLNNDILDVIEKIPNEIINVIVTSPPYNK